MLARLAGRRAVRPARLGLSSRHNSTYTPYNPDAEAREEEQVDVCIVGGGPAGLSAAIRLKQLEAETGKEVRVVVLEKGSEVGAHILSGAVIEPSALDLLLPDWRSSDHPLSQPMNNKGNYVASLSRVAAWLGGVAEELGAEVYAGFAGARFLFSDEPDATNARGGPVHSVRGVVTHDAGLTKQRTKSSRFEPGIAFRARATLLAEGAHGSLSKTAISMYDLRHNSQPQTYGIGLKEVWRVDPAKYVPGKVVHTIGWPMDWSTYGGGWEYHMADGLVSIGLVVGLDYKNPYLEPYREFQRMKHHPYYRNLLASGERLAYGGRTLTEGGIQSLPRLDFPGGALLGCSAGVVNTAKIKGTHNAMRTGMLAAETAFASLHPGTTFIPIASPETFKPSESTETTDAESEIISLESYAKAFVGSPVYKDLWAVRNVRPAFGGRFGTLGGVLYAGFDTLLGGRVPWTLKHHGAEGVNASTASPDALATLPAEKCKPIEYPPFEPPLSTDLMSSVSLTGTNHAEGQPVHLRVMRGVDGPANSGVGMQPEGVDTAETALRRRAHVEANSGLYAGLLQRACPAGVYEYVPDDGAKVVPGNAETASEQEGWDGKKLVINSQNCIHCKLCDIKVPTQDITWTVPEGGGGPKYSLT
ncbi:Electron transfer flavoprotein-ubiquinone oxidoreductase [Mycena chlorophos]|uniref:Electron transfer flavoprotein-ubiquinone oxidoreductase n=1 Tax=Mycena chlorophos TaxID=658473 RepID=A0A8H6SMT0_MYCCL|nr:Electron transfer flavoprotein-ubiquinone oxidoreductase [Mycena chlorophos]